MTKLKLTLLILLLLAASFVRFFNFNNRLTFGPEQAISLIYSAEKIDRFSLLGMPYLQRQNSLGFNLWHAPLFPYSLIPLQLIFNYDPYPITVYFVFLNLFTGFLLFYLTFKLTKTYILSYLAAFFFLFDPSMIHHSLFIWIVNYFPLIGILTGYLIIQLLLKYKWWHSLVLGLLSGIGLGLDLAYLTLIPFVTLLILIPKHRLRNLTLFILGGLLANLPTIIFDLRHDFFHLRIFYQFFLDYRAGLVSATPVYYHFLHFYPFFFVLLAASITLLTRVSKKIYLLPALTMFIYLFYLIKSPYFNLKQSLGMPEGITLNTYKDAAVKIAQDNPEQSFNLATLHDFDTRAHPLRYLVTYVHKLKPESVTDYQNLNTLYVLAPDSYDLNNPQVWELQIHQPYSPQILADYPDYNLVKLTKK